MAFALVVLVLSALACLFDLAGQVVGERRWKAEVARLWAADMEREMWEREKTLAFLAARAEALPGPDPLALLARRAKEREKERARTEAALAALAAKAAEKERVRSVLADLGQRAEEWAAGYAALAALERRAEERGLALLGDTLAGAFRPHRERTAPCLPQVGRGMELVVN